MPPKKGSGGVFDKQVFCTTGSFSVSCDEIKKLVIQNGGSTVPTPNKSCTFLIAESLGSTKTNKAINDGLDIVTEAWIRESIKKGVMATDAKYFLSGGGNAGPMSSSSKADDDDEDAEDDDDEDFDDKKKGKGKKKAAPKKAPAAPRRKVAKAASDDDVDDDDEDMQLSLTFKDQNICFTGTFSRPVKAMNVLITQNGGSIAKTCNKSCTYLVAAAMGTGKTDKAIADGMNIVNEAWVDESIMKGMPATDPKYFFNMKSTSSPIDVDDDEEEDDEDDSKKKPKKKAPAKKSAPKAAPKRKKKAASDDDDGGDDDGDDDDDDQPPVKKTKAAASAPVAPNIKIVTVKGAAPVDEQCPKASYTHVYTESASDVYDAMLNQTNIGNNNNKFYIVQLLESDNAPHQYFVWTRWGRVGANGQNALFPCGSLDDAKKQFDKKFHDKTKNHWSDKDDFVSVSGKYTLLERDYSADADEDEAPAAAASSSSSSLSSSSSGPIASKLDKRVQDLISLICDLKMMTAAMLEVGYDANKLPLGKLSKEHIKKGYIVLQDISVELGAAAPGVTKSTGGSGKGGSSKELIELSNKFYTLIPHVTRGIQRPPIINTVGLLKEKILMIESLADVAIATVLLKSNAATEATLHPVDAQYDKLKCAFTPLPTAGADFQMVRTYVKNTHGHTHQSYTLEVLDVFALDREGEAGRFSAGGYDGYNNTQLLWHGSRLTNFVGIISQGLRIAPPEAPVTGYMFGKGVYFADMVSKSANYCNASRSSNVACMLLCEVALGNMNELDNADYNASTLPAGKHSTKGRGSNYPDPKGHIVLDNGVIVPCGTEQKTNAGQGLLYNEFITYDTHRIKMKYLVKLKFGFNQNGW